MAAHSSLLSAVHSQGDSLGFEVRLVDESKGRGLLALRKYDAGAVIFEEKPLVSSQFLWNESYGYGACEYCMRSLETAEENSRRLSADFSLSLPYPECCSTKPEEHVICAECQVKYCSESCRQLAWDEYHKALCMGSQRFDSDHPINKLQDYWKSSHYPPETASIMLLGKMVAMVKQSSEKQSLLDEFANFHNLLVNDDDVAHKLLGKQFKNQLVRLRQLFTDAFYTEECEKWFTEEGFATCMALIGMNCQGIGTSPLSIWVRRCDKLNIFGDEKRKLDEFIDNLYDQLDKESGTAFLNNEGSGLYRLQSTCNHSCEPNAEVTFPYNNNVLCLKTFRTIDRDEEICISYLDECNLDRSRHSRQKILLENYLFNCNCTRCEQQRDIGPDVTSDEEDGDDDEMDG